MRKGLLFGAAAVVAVIAGVFVWIWFSGDVEPSSEITAPPVTATTAPATATTVAGAGSATVPSDVSALVFAIVQEESAATFTLDEELRGTPTTVVGTTDQVAAEILIDFEQPSNSTLGTIVINARTLETDQSFRNRAVRGPILDTDSFEFITFTPTEVSGLPDEPADAFMFTVVGDLTIRDVTLPVTFEVTIESASSESVSGFAEALVLRSDFGLQIPSAPGVANVSDEVQLDIVFVARPAS